MLVPSRSLLMVLALVLPASSQGAVHVVDAAGGPGSDFTTIGAAVGAAASGDVVLVRAGDYDPEPLDEEVDGVALTAKGLCVVADVGAAVRMSVMEVKDLPAGQFVLLQGLRVTPAEFTELDFNAGPIWVENCSHEPVFASLLSGGVRAQGCAALSWTRSLAKPPPLLVPNSGLSASDSKLALFDSDVRAGADGSMALILDTHSRLTLSGTSVLGGDGADGSNFLDCPGHPGGHALVVRGASQAFLLDSVMEGGDGGAPFSGSCSAGADGEDVLLQSGSTTTLAIAARSLVLSSPVREDETLQATFTGEPGDLVWLAYSLRPGPGIRSARWDGELVLAAPRWGLFVGTIPAGGTLVSIADAPDLPPGMESAVFFAQAIFRGARFVTSAPSALVVLDESL